MEYSKIYGTGHTQRDFTPVRDSRRALSRSPADKCAGVHFPAGFHTDWCGHTSVIARCVLSRHVYCLKMEHLDSELIIVEVQKYPCLYDIKNEEFKNRDKKRDSWMAVTAAVGDTWDEMTDENKASIGK